MEIIKQWIVKYHGERRLMVLTDKNKHFIQHSQHSFGFQFLKLSEVMRIFDELK